MKKIKVLSILLMLTIASLTLPTSVLAATSVSFDTMYAQTFSLVNSLSEENYDFDCITFVLSPEATASGVEITPEVLGISDNYTVERIFAPSVWNKDPDLVEKDIYAVHTSTQLRTITANVLTKLQTNELVESANVDTVLQTTSAVYPNDGSYYLGYEQAKCSIDRARNYTTGSSSVVVAVLDSGICYDHPDLAQNIWTNSREIPNDGIDNDRNGYVDDYRGWDFVGGDNDPYDGSPVYHGTHVAGIIGAVGNNMGVAGVCWNVKMVPVRVSGAGGATQAYHYIRGIDYVARLNFNTSIPIINMSVSAIPSDVANAEATYDVSFESATNSYSGLIVAGAGNYTTNIDTSPSYPASYTAYNIITVASLSADDELDTFSNYGVASVDLAAHGNNVWSTNGNDSYVQQAGTSQATPFVTGTAALILSLNPTASTFEIKNAILQGVDEVADFEEKVMTGGRLNARKALSYFVTLGDADQNGVVNVGDLTVVQNHITAPYLTGNRLLAADVTEDDVVDVTDIMTLRNIIMQTSS